MKATGSKDFSVLNHRFWSLLIKAPHKWESSTSELRLKLSFNFSIGSCAFCDTSLNALRYIRLESKMPITVVYLGLFHLSYSFLATFSGYILAFPQLQKAPCWRTAQYIHRRETRKIDKKIKRKYGVHCSLAKQVGDWSN